MGATAGSRPAGILLAGGRSARMGGSPKSHARVCGRPLFEYALELLEGTADPILISANDPALFSGCGHRVVPDSTPGLGPLVGLASCLSALPAEAVAIALACDMPLLSAKLVAVLAEARGSAAAAHYRTGDRVFPFPLVITAVSAPELARLLATGCLQMRRILERIRSRPVDLDPGRAVDLFNVNTPGDLQEAEIRCRQRLSSP